MRSTAESLANTCLEYPLLATYRESDVRHTLTRRNSRDGAMYWYALSCPHGDHWHILDHRDDDE